MKYIYLFLLIVLSFSSAFAKVLKFDLDWATFKYDSSSTLYELYYSLPENQIKYELTDSLYKGEVLFSVNFSSAKFTNQVQWIIEHSIKPGSGNEAVNLVSQKSFTIPPGLYDITIVAKDLKDTTKIFSKKIHCDVPLYNSVTPSISDIEPVSSVISEGKEQVTLNKNFYKNSLYVIPNPIMEFSGEEPEIKSYVELYNFDKTSDKKVDLEYRLFDSYNNEVYFYPKHLKTMTPGIVETISLPVSAVPTGVYKFQVKALFENNTKDSIIKTKKIYLINDGIPPQKQEVFSENQLFAASEFSTLSDEGVGNEYLKIRSMLSGLEKEEFESLTALEAKRRFLYRYWAREDNDSIPNVNLNLLEFRQREEYANKHFGFSTTPGWKTDRGKIYLKYGVPTNMDYTPPGEEARPYETWFYAGQQGGIYFYFVDMTSTGNMILVNSTAYGEIRNDNWFAQYVQKQNTINPK